MDGVLVAAALASAFLHAAWNAAVKATPRPAEAMAGQMIMAAVISVPILLWTGLPDVAALKWVALSSTINAFAVATMLRAYDAAGYGVVYPVGRAVSVMIVLPMAALLLGERMGPSAIAGVAMIAASLALLAASARGEGGVPARGLAWMLASGICIALYVLCDAQGVRASRSALAYGCLASIANGAVMAWRQRHLGNPVQLVASFPAITVVAGFASMASYLLILWAWDQGPIAPAAALRDTSAIFALLIAVFWLKEPFDRLRIAAVLLSAAAVPLLRLG
jgi:drug/metabolite transporter (DMT)-like permease